MTTISLRKVDYMPPRLEPGVLYVSEEFGVAVHLCACGCGNKISVPIGPSEWTLTERNGRPSLWPSIGSGQLPCESHYVIRNGRIEWAPKMSAQQTQSAMRADQRRREAHYKTLQPKPGFVASLWQRLLRFLGIR